MDQQENNDKTWFMPDDFLSSYNEYKKIYEEYLKPDLAWFQQNIPFNGDTDREKKEQEIVTKELIGLGILKVVQRPPQESIPLFTAANNKIPGTVIPTDIINPINEQPQQKSKTIFNLLGTAKKLGPNEKCHCGSGKKFKKCHGR